MVQEDFDLLLDCLETIDGKFLLSSSRNKFLAERTKQHGWFTIEIEMRKSVSHGRKDEVLTANYPIGTE